MACEEEGEQEQSTSVLKLPLLPLKSHTHTHTPSLASPIHPTLASVPFSWEEEPGKPKPQSSSSSSSSCSPYSKDQTSKSLELPPRLVFLEKEARSISKLSSPTTVLDGPYSMGRSRRFESPSFKMMVMGSGDRYGSFRSDIYGDMEEVEEDYHQLQQQQHWEQSSGSLVLARKRTGGGGYRGRLGFVGLWRKRALKGNGEFGGGSYVFPSSVDRESDCSRKEEEEEEEEDIFGGNVDGDSTGSFNKTKIKRIGRTGSFATVPPPSKSHFWTAVYEGLKQVVPWKSKKMKG